MWKAQSQSPLRGLMESQAAAAAMTVEAMVVLWTTEVNLSMEKRESTHTMDLTEQHTKLEVWICLQSGNQVHLTEQLMLSEPPLNRNANKTWIISIVSTFHTEIEQFLYLRFSHTILHNQEIVLLAYSAVNSQVDYYHIVLLMINAMMWFEHSVR